VSGPAIVSDSRSEGTQHPTSRRSYRVHAIRAHLLQAAGRDDEAAEEYRTAARRTLSTPERQYLLRQAALIDQAG
jgi:predicted RNA polymerase sigma factor